MRLPGMRLPLVAYVRSFPTSDAADEFARTLRLDTDERVGILAVPSVMTPEGTPAGYVFVVVAERDLAYAMGWHPRGEAPT